jgi:hypothetical protein
MGNSFEFKNPVERVEDIESQVTTEVAEILRQPVDSNLERLRELRDAFAGAVDAEGLKSGLQTFKETTH